MTNAEIKNILMQHNVTNLFHANTVLTSLSFLKNQGLCSRQYIEDTPDSHQTGQYSDKTDKKLGVYNDIFFDSVDIHKRTRGVNYYGPIMFVYSLDLLSAPEVDNTVRITRENPAKWATDRPLTDEDKYFMTAFDLSYGFQKGAFKQHITLHDVPKISFQYLQEIHIDPLPEKYKKIFENAYYTLRDAIYSAGLNTPLIIRNCDLECKCREKYMNLSEYEIIKKYSCEVNTDEFVCGTK